MAWSYNAGERGKGNWVRAYQDAPRVTLYLEWLEDIVGDDGEVVRGKRGKPKQRRRRQRLDHVDKRRAKQQADALSDQFLLLAGGGGTVHQIMADYLREVTPEKGSSKRDHDQRAARLFMLHLPSTLLAAQLDRTQWDSYIRARRAGAIEGYRPVGDRVIAYDLKFLISVLGWAVGTGRLIRHPWGPEIRKTQKWKMPRNPTPQRKGMPDDVRTLLIQHSPNWRFELALEMGRMTVSRNSSVRQIQWLDIDFGGRTVHWRNEKNEWDVVTPLPDRAVELLKHAPSRGIGQAFVFPSPEDSTQPCSRHAFQRWLKTAKRRLLRSIQDPVDRERMKERLKGVGFHSEKRSAVRQQEFRALPDKVRETLSRTRAKTLNDVYDEVPMDELRAAVKRIS